MDGARLPDDVERFGEDEEKTDCDDGRVVAGGQRGEHDQKGLVRSTRGHVAPPDERGDATGELPNDFVGDAIFRCLSDLPEAIDLQAQNTNRSLIALCKRDRLVELDKGKVPSGQAGLAVDETKRAQLLPCVAEAHE